MRNEEGHNSESWRISVAQNDEILIVAPLLESTFEKSVLTLPNESATNSIFQLHRKGSTNSSYDLWCTTLLALVRLLEVAVILLSDEKHGTTTWVRWHVVVNHIFADHKHSRGLHSSNKLVRREYNGIFSYEIVVRTLDNGTHIDWNIWRCTGVVPHTKHIVLVQECRNSIGISENPSDIGGSREGSHKFGACGSAASSRTAMLL
mmetsp:Transcript_10544/g.39214  ORF Transcript_10544/g.39214 Transcript_10544/m.39214 type:complete len:205 (-) Transcript_10544:826-1440(-)